MIINAHVKILSVIGILMLFVGCDSKKTLQNAEYKSKYSLYIFKFANPQFQDHIIAKLDTTGSTDSKNIVLPSAFPRRDLYGTYYYLEQKYLICDPKLSYVICDTAALRSEMQKVSMCDLANGKRLIALADGYYMWYPFTAIPVFEEKYPVMWWRDPEAKSKMSQMAPVALSAKWEDICSFNIDTVHILSMNPYSEVHGLIHMYEYTKDMTVDELVETVNRLIKEKDFAHGGQESYPWFNQ